MQLRDAALKYAAAGLHVFRLGERGKLPLAGSHGHLDATTDLETIRGWWGRIPYNVGIACVTSGLVVLDIDRRHGGHVTLSNIEGAHECLPSTWTVATANGWHLYFHDAGAEYVGKLGPGIDIKHRGFVLAPPSVHPSGAVYRWTHKRGVRLAELPAWARTLMARPLLEPARVVSPPRADSAVDVVERARKYIAKCPPAVSGQHGHDHTFAVAVRLVRGFSLPADVAYALLSEWNRACLPPWSERDLRRKVAQAAQFGRMAWGELRDSNMRRSA